MTPELEQETARLRRAWERHSADWLGHYLVSGVEDPRINGQSILTRHCLLDALVGSRFAALRTAEHRFGAVMRWLVSILPSLEESHDLPVLQHGLRQRADQAEGLAIPPFVAETYAGLPAEVDGVEIPNYLNAALEVGQLRAGGPLEVFAQLWSRVLAAEEDQRLSVLEPACGSANDYRFFARYGLARLLDYTGLDLCEANVRNAQAAFPEVRFAHGNVFQLPWPDQAFEVTYVHDLFEHLSRAGLTRAIAEICRVTRRALCLGFFSMHEAPAPVVRPAEEYYCNTLSLETTRALFEQHGFTVQAVHLATFLHWRVGGPAYHNPNAYSFIARRGAGCASSPP